MGGLNLGNMEAEVKDERSGIGDQRSEISGSLQTGDLIFGLWLWVNGFF